MGERSPATAARASPGCEQSGPWGRGGGACVRGRWSRDVGPTQGRETPLRAEQGAPPSFPLHGNTSSDGRKALHLTADAWKFWKWRPGNERKWTEARHVFPFTPRRRGKCFKGGVSPPRAHAQLCTHEPGTARPSPAPRPHHGSDRSPRATGGRMWWPRKPHEQQPRHRRKRGPLSLRAKPAEAAGPWLAPAPAAHSRKPVVNRGRGALVCCPRRLGH